MYVRARGDTSDNLIDPEPPESDEHHCVLTSAIRAEPAVRDFLLARADIVRFSAITWETTDSFGDYIIMCGGMRDPDFKTCLKNLEGDLLCVEDGIEPFRNGPDPDRLKNYYFRRSPATETLLKFSTLNYRPRHDMSMMYGLAHPAFFQTTEAGRKMIGIVSSNEHKIYVYASGADWAHIKKTSRTYWSY